MKQFFKWIFPIVFFPSLTSIGIFPYVSEISSSLSAHHEQQLTKQVSDANWAENKQEKFTRSASGKTEQLYVGQKPVKSVSVNDLEHGIKIEQKYNAWQIFRVGIVNGKNVLPHWEFTPDKTIMNDAYVITFTTKIKPCSIWEWKDWLTHHSGQILDKNSLIECSVHIPQNLTFRWKTNGSRANFFNGKGVKRIDYNNWNNNSFDTADFAFSNNDISLTMVNFNSNTNSFADINYSSYYYSKTSRDEQNFGYQFYTNTNRNYLNNADAASGTVFHPHPYGVSYMMPTPTLHNDNLIGLTLDGDNYYWPCKNFYKWMKLPNGDIIEDGIDTNSHQKVYVPHSNRGGQYQMTNYLGTNSFKHWHYITPILPDDPLRMPYGNFWLSREAMIWDKSNEHGLFTNFAKFELNDENQIKYHGFYHSRIYYAYRDINSNLSHCAKEGVDVYLHLPDLFKDVDPIDVDNPSHLFNGHLDFAKFFSLTNQSNYINLVVDEPTKKTKFNLDIKLRLNTDYLSLFFYKYANDMIYHHGLVNFSSGYLSVGNYANLLQEHQAEVFNWITGYKLFNFNPDYQYVSAVYQGLNQMMFNADLSFDDNNLYYPLILNETYADPNNQPDPLWNNDHNLDYILTNPAQFGLPSITDPTFWDKLTAYVDKLPDLPIKSVGKNLLNLDISDNTDTNRYYWVNSSKFYTSGAYLAKIFKQYLMMSYDISNPDYANYNTLTFTLKGKNQTQLGSLSARTKEIYLATLVNNPSHDNSAGISLFHQEWTNVLVVNEWLANNLPKATDNTYTINIQSDNQHGYRFLGNHDADFMFYQPDDKINPSQVSNNANLSIIPTTFTYDLQTPGQWFKNLQGINFTGTVPTLAELNQFIYALNPLQLQQLMTTGTFDTDHLYVDSETGLPLTDASHTIPRWGIMSNIKPHNFFNLTSGDIGLVQQYFTNHADGMVVSLIDNHSLKVDWKLPVNFSADSGEFLTQKQSVNQTELSYPVSFSVNNTKSLQLATSYLWKLADKDGGAFLTNFLNTKDAKEKVNGIFNTSLSSSFFQNPATNYTFLSNQLINDWYKHNPGKTLDLTKWQWFSDELKAKFGLVQPTDQDKITWVVNTFANLPSNYQAIDYLTPTHPVYSELTYSNPHYYIIPDDSIVIKPLQYETNPDVIYQWIFSDNLKAKNWNDDIKLFWVKPLSSDNLVNIETSYFTNQIGQKGIRVHFHLNHSVLKNQNASFKLYFSYHDVNQNKDIQFNTTNSLLYVNNSNSDIITSDKTYTTAEAKQYLSKQHDKVNWNITVPDVYWNDIGETVGSIEDLLKHQTWTITSNQAISTIKWTKQSDTTFISNDKKYQLTTIWTKNGNLNTFNITLTQIVDQNVNGKVLVNTWNQPKANGVVVDTIDYLNPPDPPIPPDPPVPPSPSELNLKTILIPVLASLAMVGTMLGLFFILKAKQKAKDK